MTQAKRFSNKRVRGAGRGLLAAFAFLLVATPALAGTSRGYENGGFFSRFDPVVEEFNRSGKEFRIVGLCQSACTLFLSIRNVCVEPQAVFQFHAGHDGKGNVSTSATLHMINSYNPMLRNFVIERGFMETLSFSTIPARDIIEKFGYPACGPRTINTDMRDTDTDTRDSDVSEKIARPSDNDDVRSFGVAQGDKDTGR